MPAVNAITNADLVALYPLLLKDARALCRGVHRSVPLGACPEDLVQEGLARLWRYVLNGGVVQSLHDFAYKTMKHLVWGLYDRAMRCMTGLSRQRRLLLHEVEPTVAPSTPAEEPDVELLPGAAPPPEAPDAEDWIVVRDRLRWAPTRCGDRWAVFLLNGRLLALARAMEERAQDALPWRDERLRERIEASLPWTAGDDARLLAPGWPPALEVWRRVAAALLAGGDASTRPRVEALARCAPDGHLSVDTWHQWVSRARGAALERLTPFEARMLRRWGMMEERAPKKK